MKCGFALSEACGAGMVGQAVNWEYLDPGVERAKVLQDIFCPGGQTGNFHECFDQE